MCLVNGKNIPRPKIIEYLISEDLKDSAKLKILLEHGFEGYKAMPDNWLVKEYKLRTGLIEQSSLF